MGTLPAFVPFQVPKFDLGETYTQMARLAAWEQERRARAFEMEERRGTRDRQSQVRQLLADAFQPQTEALGQGFAAAQPQSVPPPGALPPQGQAMPPQAATLPQEPTMPPVGVSVPVNTQNGTWGQPGGVAGTQPGMPPPSTAMAPPVDPSQPPLQGGGFTQAPAAPTPPGTGGLTQTPPGTPPVPQTGFTAPQPQRDLRTSVPGLMPLPNMQKVQQAMAIDPTYAGQALSTYLTQRSKQVEEIDRNNKLVYQVTGAILDNPEMYQQGLDYLREQGVPVPKNMPPTYNAALVNFHHKAAQERMSPLEAEKVKTQQLINQFLPQAIRRMQQGGGGGEAAPAAGGGGEPAQPPATASAAAAPRGTTGLDTAVIEATKLYPQVRPALVHGIIRHESNYDPQAVSPKGAYGPMQLMPGTAKDMGVDPKNPAENVRGGVRYYAQLLTKYDGNEALALAAYNWGPGNVDKVNGDLTKMPQETQTYVKNVLATASSGQRGPAGTQGQVAGPGAPAPSPSPEVQRLERQIAASRQKLADLEPLVLADPQRYNALVVNEQKTLDDLRAERNRLEERQTEVPRAVARVTAEEQARYGERQRQQGGPMLPQDRRKLLTDLRQDIRQEPTFQTYQAVRNGYQNVEIGAEGNNAIGDLAIVNGIAKIFDPGSAVMRGEAQTVEEAQGRLQVILNSPQRFFEGDRLTPQARQSILALAQRLARQKLTTAEKELRQVYEPFAKEGGFEFRQLLPLEDIPATTGSAAAKEDLLKKHTR